MALFDQIAEDFIEILVKINMDKYSDEIFMVSIIMYIIAIIYLSILVSTFQSI